MTSTRLRFAFFVGVALSAGLLAGCPQNGQVVLPGPGSVPPHGQLYAANAVFVGPSPSAVPGNISVFQAPFSATTAQTGTISSGLLEPVGVAVDPTDATGKVFVSDINGQDLEVYARPNPGGGAPMFALALPTASPGPTVISFDAAGNLYVPNDRFGGKVYQYTHTVGSGSTASALSLTIGKPICVALDSSANLYAVDSSTSTNTLDMFGPSHSGAAVASTTIGLSTSAIGCAVDPLNQDAYVVNVSLADRTVVGFASPLTASATPIVIITWPAGVFPTGIGFDSSGNLYVAAATIASPMEVISVFNASSLSGTAITPSAAAFSFSNGQYEATQIAIGP